MEYADVSEKPASSFSGVCLHFEPQKWRKTKCKTCFEDAKKHKYVKVYGVTSGEINDEISNDLDANEPRNCTESFSECYEDSYWKELEKADGLFPENTRDEMGSKRDRPFSQNRPLPATEDCTLHLKTENELSRSDALDMNNSSHTQEVDSPIMARKHSRTLSRNSTLEYSSTSSLDALEDANTTSSLSHGFSADTLDSLGLTSGDELDSMDNVLDFVPSRKVSDLKVVELQQELESLRDTQKAVEAGKDKHIQGLEREIQNLRLELTNFSARENVLMLKNRLELEGKSLRISDLENEVQHLKSTIASITLSRTSDEDSHDKLQGNIHRCNQRIKSLEEENKTLQERISLAEDLQTNDRELLDVLRNQLNVLERDLLVSQEKCRNLEDRIKTYKEIESDLSDERVKNSELTKQMEFLNEKIKKRDRLMSCLEDDNVKLEHLMKEFKDKTRKDQSVIEKLDEKVKVLQQNITECNDAIERLSNENKVLEHEHWHETIKQADVSNSVQNYIEQLEEKTRQMELKLKELENENDHLVSEISELLENSVIMNTECENLKGQLRKAENETNDLKELREEQDKKITVMQRKLKKADKEKKRIQMEKTKLEAQLIDLKTDYEKVAKFEDLEKGYRMIELKLQSTEAKLTMIEGNKTYLESKLAEYEKKSFSVEEILNKINLIINSHILDSIEESVTGDQSVYFENKSLEEKLGKILKDKKENQQLLSIVKERNCSLTETIASLERQLDESKNQLNCFITENKQLKVELDEKSLLLMNLKNFLQLGLQQLIKQNNVLENKVTEITKLSTATTILESHLKSERHRAACGRLETWSYKNQLQKYEEKYDRLKEDQHQLLIHIEYLSKLNQLLQLSVHTLEKENAKLSVSSTKQKEIVSLERSRGKKEIIKHDKPSSKQRERRQSSEKERKRNSRLVAPDSVKQPNDITDCELLVLNSDSKATNQEDIHDFDTLDKLEGIKSAFIEIPQTKFPSNDDAGGNPSQSSILADTQSTSEAMSHNEVKSSTCAETSAPESFLLDDCLPLKNASNPISHGSFSLKDCLVADTGNGVSDTNTNSMFIDNEILIDTTENVEQSSENEEGTIVLNTTEKEAPFFELQQIRSKENKRASDEDSKSDGQKATRHWDNLSISKICDFEQLINSADRISKKIIKEASVLYVEGKNKIEHQENSTKEQSMGTPGQGNKTRIISSKEGEGSIKEREV